MVFQELLSGISGGKILDVGCGSGQFIEILTGSLGSFESVTGVDVDSTALQEARTRFREDAYRFLQASSQSLPFASGTFDLVSISKALHHVEDDRRTIGEMKRVLRRGGYFLVNEMIRDDLSVPQQSYIHFHHLRSDIDGLIGVSHHYTYHRKNLLELIDLAGLQDLIVREYQPEEASEDPAHADEFIFRMKSWLDELVGHPEQKEYSERVEALRKHIRKNGITRPTQLIALGRKNN
jgi:ubiquinone/menaquinone biosynthesis C-methylase UbiE